jgi:hypothetical protein
MGRDVTADTTPLLMNAEQNIGNSEIVNPQEGTEGTVVPTTNPPRILNLTGGSAVGQTVSVVMTVSRLLKNQNPNPGFPGPITGVIEFGNGTRSTRVEFDLVVGPFTGQFTQASEAVEPQDGIVVVTVPTGVLRVYARYDNLLLAPVLGTNPPMSQAQVTRDYLPMPTLKIVGPGGPLDVALSPPVPPPPAPQYSTVDPEPVLVKAMVSYFTKPRAKVYKTINCYLSPEIDPPVAIEIGTPNVPNPAGYTGYSFFALPPYTKSVKILRFPGVAMDAILHDGIRPVEYINITAAPVPPTIPVVGNECIIGINSLGNKVHLLKLVCEIGI